MTIATNYTPVRSKRGRYLCDYDPIRRLLLFRSGKGEEVVDLAEYDVMARPDLSQVPMSALGYVLLPVEVARLLKMVGGEGE